MSDHRHPPPPTPTAAAAPLTPLPPRTPALQTLLEELCALRRVIPTLS